MEKMNNSQKLFKKFSNKTTRSISQKISTKIEFLFFLIKSMNVFLTISPYIQTNISLKA